MKKIIIAAAIAMTIATSADAFTCAEVRAAYGQYCTSVPACIRWARAQGYSWADIRKALACLRR